MRQHKADRKALTDALVRMRASEGDLDSDDWGEACDDALAAIGRANDRGKALKPLRRTRTDPRP
jgi:hypothetical protein